MEAEDMRLESAVLQLNPARTRCELVVTLRDGEEQSLGTGLVETFANHLGAIREQILESGSRLIKLQPEDGEDSSWFTKDTFESFLKFVNSPELLERAVGVRDELLRLVNSASLGDEGASTRDELEARRCVLEKEYAASGFTEEDVRKLQLFASKFGDAGLLAASENFMAGYTGERIKTEGVGYISASLNQVSASVLSKRSGTPSVVRGENGVGEIATGISPDRRLSVQEKISMFEKTMGAGHDDGRRSIDAVDRLGVQKPVLRRWSLAENSRGGRGGPTSGETEAIMEDIEAESSSGQQAGELAVYPAESGNQSEDCTRPQSDSFRSLFCPVKSEQKLSGIAEGRDDDQNSVASDTQSLIDKKGRLYDQYKQRRDEKLREEPGSRRAERQAKLKKMQETLERRRGEIARAATKVNPLVEAQVRAAKLRAFKAGLLEMKKEKDEEEKRRLEALRVQRQKQAPGAAVQSPRSPHSGASTPRTGVITKQMKGFLPTFQRAVPSTGTNNNSMGSRNPQVSQQPQQQQQQQLQQKLPAKGQKNAAQATATTMPPVKKPVEGGAAISRLRKPTSTAALRKSLSSLTEAQGLKLSTQLMSDAAEEAEQSRMYARRRSESFRLPSSSATEPAKQGLATAVAVSQPAASSAVIRARVTADDDDVAGFGGGDNDELAEEETGYDEESAVEYKAPIAPVSLAASPVLLQGS